jgi:hypothetical protein
VTAIKPPGGPRGAGGVEAPRGPGGAESTNEPTGPSFQNRVAEQQSANAAKPASATASASSSQAVVADLRAGKISPDTALRRLTDLAVQRSGAPAALRPGIEARLRELMTRDPNVRDLVREMGATLDVGDEK